jgi:hypothetical protein
MVNYFVIIYFLTISFVITLVTIFQNWNIDFQIQITIIKIEIGLVGITNRMKLSIVTT